MSTKKILTTTLCLLIALIILTSCEAKTTPQPTAQTSVPKPTETQPTDAQATPAETKPTETQPSSPQIPKELKELLTKRKAVKTIQYDYKTAKTPAQYKVYVMGDIVKAVPAADQTLTENGEFFTSIYLNTKARTAEGYCDQKELCNTKNNGPFNLDYEEYQQKTPFDFAEELEQGKYYPLEKESGEVLIEGRPTTTFSLNIGEVKTKFYVDKFYGVPLKVESTKEGPAGLQIVENHIYDSISFNSVNLVDITPPKSG